MEEKGFLGRIIERIVEKKQLLLVVVGLLSLPIIYLAANTKTGLFSRASSSNQNGYTIYSSDPQTGEYFDLSISPTIKTIIENNIANKANVTFKITGLRVAGKQSLFGAVQKSNTAEYSQTFNFKKAEATTVASFDSDQLTLVDNPHDGCIDIHTDATRTKTNYVATFCYNISFPSKSDNLYRMYSFNANPFFEYKYKGTNPTTILSLTTGFNKYTDGRAPNFTGKIRPTKLNGFFIDNRSSLRDFTNLSYNIQAITSGLSEPQQNQLCQPKDTDPKIYLRYSGELWYEGGNLIDVKTYQHGCNFEVPQNTFIHGWMNLWTETMYPQNKDTQTSPATLTLKKVDINLFDIVTTVGAKGVPLSTLGYGTNINSDKLYPIFKGVTYEWGMSSLNTTGTLQSNGGIATFIPLKQGEGDIFVTARYDGKSVTSFVKVSVANAGTTPRYEECNNHIDDDGDGLIDERCNIPTNTPSRTPTNIITKIPTKTLTNIPTRTPTPTQTKLDLVTYWKLDDNVSGNGKTIKDASGHNHTMTTEIGKNNTGMNCTDAGKIGKACTFDGVDDRTHGTSTLSFGTKSTIITWVKTSSGGAIFGSRSTPLLNTIYLRIYKGKVQGITDLSGNWPRNSVTSKKSVNDDTWHHVAFVMDEFKASVYIDGILDNTATLASKGGFTDKDWYVGYSDATWTPAYFKGQIDNLKIYNSALPANQIAEDMISSSK